MRNSGEGSGIFGRILIENIIIKVCRYNQQWDFPEGNPIADVVNIQN